MVQCLVDSWRNTIGSTGISVVLAFCESQDELANSDEECVEFAKELLLDFSFLYRDADDNNKKVCLLDADRSYSV